MQEKDKLLAEWSNSNISESCLVRLTNRCDQECRHCFSRSGPKCIGQMTVSMCDQINTWTPDNVFFNVMGGEFSLLDNYPELLLALVRGKKHIRLVTNGFWANQNPDKFFDTLRAIKATECHPKVVICISNDIFHSKSSNNAIMSLRDNASWIKVETTIGFDLNDISPVGRAWDNNMSPEGEIICNCQNMCNMTIIENGMLSLCPFGYFPWKHFTETTWKEAQEHILEWRSRLVAAETRCNTCMEIDASGKDVTQWDG